METIQSKKEIEITKEDFDSYDRVRISGVTNMWAIDLVCSLSGLTEEKVFYIMRNFEELSNKFLLVK